MMFLSPFARVILFTTTILVGWGPAVNGQDARLFPGGSSRTRSSSGQMRVIESLPQRQASKHFTIVGEVQRSAVYESPASSLSLGQLIAVSGGLTDFARQSIKVIRDGKDSLRLFYDPTHPDEHQILAGDIVVVLPSMRAAPQSRQTPMIPIACTGLDTHPIVLPLDPSISTVEILLAELIQPASVRESIRLIDPYSRPHSNQLVSGSVVMFNPTLVDRRGLAATEAFPSTVKLDAQGRLLETSDNSAPSEQRADVAPLQQVPPPIPDRTAPLSTLLEPSIAPSAVAPSTSPPPPLPLPSTPASTVMSSAGQAETESIATASPREVDRNALALTDGPELLSTDLPLIEETPQNEIPAPLAEVVGVTPIPTPAPPPPEVKTVATTAVRSGSPAQPQHASPRQNDASGQSLADSPPEAHAGSQADADSGSVWPVILCLAAIVLLGLPGAIIWARSKNPVKSVSTHERHDPLHRDTGVHHLPASPLQDRQTLSQQQCLDLVLNRATPVVMEQVEFPRDIVVQGEAVALRRLILHDRHPQHAAPHFTPTERGPGQRAHAVSTANRETVTASSTEKPANAELNASAPTDSAETPKETAASDPIHASQPTASNMHRANQFDIVAPEADRSSATPRPSSALERALQILAKEKQT